MLLTQLWARKRLNIFLSKIFVNAKCVTKKMKIIPLVEWNEANSMISYRPLLSVISHVFERLIVNHIIQFVKENSITCCAYYLDNTIQLP